MPFSTAGPRCLKHVPTAFLLLLSALLPGAEAQRPELADDTPFVDGRWTNTEEDFSFVILGDKTSGGEGKWPIYDEAVATINGLSPDFVITIGDMIPGHMEDRPAWDAEWAEYMLHARAIEAPLFFTVGNHDIANTACHRFWQEDLGRTYYSFDYKGCHFLVLNTEEERIDGRGPVWQKMMGWAEKDLAKSGDARHTYVLFHKAMWDDPRYEEDWARIEAALGDRPVTVVAGHEHYHSHEKRHGHDFVICSAVGGGINLSDARAWGGFHSFGHVLVEGDASTYVVVEPDGTRWPVDVAPARFRKAITHEVVTFETPFGQTLEGERATLSSAILVQNPLDQNIEVRVRVANLDETDWAPRRSSHWTVEDDALVARADLTPGKRASLPLVFDVARESLSFPPPVEWAVRYDGAWIEKETMRMVEVHTLPLHPVASYRAPERIQLVGPFPLTSFDPKHLPGDPAAASPDLVRRMGPERGFEPGARYGGGRQWVEHTTQGFGLINANALLGTLDHAVCYVAVKVYAPTARETHAIVGSDNFDQTYLNGELIEDGQGFDSPGGYVYPRLELRAGWNDLVVKLINNRGDWYLRLLIADEGGDLLLKSVLPAE